jgi:uncharacterized membrane protein
MTAQDMLRRSRAWLPAAALVLLLCSLLLNVLFGSYIAVQALVAEPQPVVPQAPRQMLALLAERLPPSDAEILWKAFRARESEIAAAVADAQRARVRAMSILGRPDLDKDAFRAAAEEMGERRMRVRKLVVDAIFEAMQHISPEARQNLAKQFGPH